MSSPRNIAVVPAKKKSRRCESKNWRVFQHGESLAERKYMTTLATGYFHKTVLSIDFNEEELDFVKKPYNQYQLRACHGATIRMRPRFMLDDSVTVMLDALEYVNANDNDYYCLLQPTSPFLQKETIQRAIHAVKADKAHGDCVVITLNPAYRPSGGLYMGRVGNIREHRSFFKPNVVPLILDWRESVDIDEEHDFEIARNLME